MAQTTYRIRGIAPTDLPRDPNIRRMYWGWVVEIGLRVKDWELARGLDKEGKKLKPIKAQTAKYRRSAMSPKKGRALSGPPLMPARELSRTRSLLAGRASENHALFYWRFDPFTGESWGQILAYQAKEGRDVIGLSPKGVAKVRAEAWERWRQWKAGTLKVAQAEASAAPGVPRVGSYATANATFGIGVHAASKFESGEWTGGMTWPEWQRYFRERNPAPVAIPGRPGGHYNRILAHVWGIPGPTGPTGTTGTKPTPPARPRPKPVPVAGPPPAKAKPAAVPVPVAGPPASPPAWQWGEPIHADLPIAERIRRSAAWERAGRLSARARDLREATEESLRLAAERDELNARTAAALEDASLSAEGRQHLIDEFDRIRMAAKTSRDRRKALEQLFRAALDAELQIPEPHRFAWDTQTDELTTDMHRQAVDEARRFVSRIVAAGARKSRGDVRFATMPADRQQRSYYNAASGKVWMAESRGASTAVHEWGHAIEWDLPGAQEAAQEFLTHRARGEPPRPMSELIPDRKWMADEVAIEDEFKRAFGDRGPYVGKVYDSGATEIVSMGVEQLYVNAAYFAEKDPEYCAFVLGVLDGSLRKP